MPRLVGVEPVVFGSAVEGFEVQVASGTSELDIEFDPYQSIVEANSLSDLSTDRAFDLAGLIDEEFNVLGGRYFVIRSVEPQADNIGGLMPAVSISVVFLGDRGVQWQKGIMVLVVVDPQAGAIVDWAAEIRDQDKTIRFELPLVPTDTDLTAFGVEDFLEQANKWDGSSELVFCIVGFPEELFAGPSDFTDKIRYGQISKLTVNTTRVAGDIAEWIDKKIKKTEVLQRIDRNGNAIADVEGNLEVYEGRVLLFCHGIFSKTESAFEGLFQDPIFLDAIQDTYDEQVLAWDHWTLSKTANDNAHDLVGRLAGLKNVSVDVICHSRGAGVIRNLFEDPALRAHFESHNVYVDVCVYVAGACLGSQLAMAKNVKRLFRRITILNWLIGGFGNSASPIIATIKALALGAQTFPGVAAMNPIGREIRNLNSFGETVAQKYAYVRSNFDALSWPLKLAEQVLWDAPIFGNKANDLIVPYDGAGRSTAYLNKSQVKRENLRSFGTHAYGQSVVAHTNFFDQIETKIAIRRALGF